MTSRRPKPASNSHQVRCAIYTRKSTEEGLEQEFNSLDAQREAGEAYVNSQRHEGWVLVQDKYDDGGFTGGNLERPALRRLMQDIESGKIDCVVVYKVDRLSRSLTDFTKLIEVFDKYRVSFVSVTQQFNTSNSMGRLVLNVLLSFAQFEREIIAERTKDKLVAMRKKGKWVGGLPPLGYNLDTQHSRLVVNPEEASRVSQIFELYSETGSLLGVVRELRDRGWLNKQSITKAGKVRGGKAFDRTSLYRMLTNVAYTGQVQCGDELYPGEHAGIINTTLFREVQETLSRNGKTGGAMVRNTSGALLKGILKCGSCGCAMTPSFTTKGNKQYRYYVCSSAQKKGRDTCETRSVSSGPIEEYVVKQIRSIGKDQKLVSEVIEKARSYDQERLEQIVLERRLLEKDLQQWRNEVQALAPLLAQAHSSTLNELARFQEQIAKTEERLRTINSAEYHIRQNSIDEMDAREALSRFDGVWEVMTPNEKGRLIDLLIKVVVYDGAKQTVTIEFEADGIRTLAQEVQQNKQESKR